jgi:hypothetical protein
MKILRLAVLAIVPASAAAQLPELSTVPTSIALSLGVRTFGTRLEGEGVSHEYANSMELDFRIERGITRRLGVMIGVHTAPFSAFKRNDGDVNVSSTKVREFGADAGISARFKPAAPIFFYVGATHIRFSAYADILEQGKTSETGGIFGIGYDKGATEDFNFRLFVGTRFMKPAEPPEGSSNSAPSLTNDWGISLGLRRAFSSQ